MSDRTFPTRDGPTEKIRNDIRLFYCYKNKKSDNKMMYSDKNNAKEHFTF